MAPRLQMLSRQLKVTTRQPRLLCLRHRSYRMMTLVPPRRHRHRSMIRLISTTGSAQREQSGTAARARPFLGPINLHRPRHSWRVVSHPARMVNSTKGKDDRQRRDSLPHTMAPLMKMRQVWRLLCSRCAASAPRAADLSSFLPMFRQYLRCRPSMPDKTQIGGLGTSWHRLSKTSDYRRRQANVYPMNVAPRRNIIEHRIN